MKRKKSGKETIADKRIAELENANRELEDFAVSVSHDLRAPLRAIDSFSRFLYEDYSDSLDAEGKRMLGVIRANAARMDRLIGDLLDLSRVSRSEVRMSRIDMSALASFAIAEAAPPGALDAFVISAQPLPAAMGDASLLRQVWCNLLSNAFKYSMKSPSRRIEIGGREERGNALYFVTDHGAGFDPEYSDKLFGVFQRLHTAEEFEGTGVGLAIVKRIVTRHGGSVWAEGKPGAGATFGFSLPNAGARP